MALLLEHAPILGMFVGGGIWVRWIIRNSPRSQTAQNGTYQMVSSLDKRMAVMENEVRHIRDDVRELKQK